MKNTLFTMLIATAVFSFTACDQYSAPRPPAELIVGKWKFEKFNIPKGKLDRLETHERAKLAQMQLQLKLMSYSFFNDGTYSMDMELSDEFTENMQRGNYRLVNDGAVLVTDYVKEKSTKTKTSESSMLRLSEDSLVISEKNDEGSMLFLRSK